jgi:hypothetical protein
MYIAKNDLPKKLKIFFYLMSLEPLKMIEFRVTKSFLAVNSKVRNYKTQRILSISHN